MPSLSIGTVASSLFTPTDISFLSLWFDASDAKTITQSSNRVSQWNDKSSKGYNVIQSTSANMPLTNQTTKNGLNVIKFDGTNDRMINSSNSLNQNVSGNTSFSVFQILSLTAEQRIWNKYTAGTSTNRLAHRQFGTSGTFQGVTRRDDAAAATIVSSTTAVNTNWNLLGMAANYSTGVVAIRLNKVQQATTSITTGLTNNTAGGDITLGYNTSTGGIHYLNGYLAELLVYEKNLTSGEIATVENYLTSKWGL